MAKTFSLLKSANLLESDHIYWLITFLLFLLQVFFTLNSTSQIRYEELAESVRNPFWLNSRYMYEGGASVSWNLLLLVIYNLFGFSLFTAKFVKLGLFAIALFCTSSILKKYLGRWQAIVPLVAISLSPTLLYFNALQNTFGIDILLLPICGYLLLSIDFKNSTRAGILFRTFLFWFLVMVSWLAYPTFLFYLPALFLLYSQKSFALAPKGASFAYSQKSFALAPKGASFAYSQKSFAYSQKFFLAKNIAVSLIGFLTPLVAVILYVKNKEVLVYDSIGHVGSLFRGNGYLDFSVYTFIKNFAFNLYYFFYRSGGYHFEVAKVDFSDFYPILAILVVALFVFRLFKNPRYRGSILSIGSVAIFAAGIVYFTPDPGPGMRRFMPILVTIYAFFILVWKYLTSSTPKIKLRKFYILILSLLALHHLIVYPINLAHIKDLGEYNEKFWFTQASTPQKSLDDYLEVAQKQNLYLTCPEKSKYCRYSEIYAAIAASCYWRKLTCYTVYGWWPKIGDFIPISIDTWKTQNFRY